ncbi:hypothetical protein [Mesorhizobium sp.]|uniref:hypothetical protein n=1 Tax=Mesorhizobium sp. TaxID=1871066 RepID=UPI000FE637EA|nr:hypothetical protein [Mesorhizobium sp.]RWK43937.1 MAG: hypothetical protein EOR46_03640 [Mesorhizobium sp.]RWK68729.1 MAG: hypothetical protein EOR54_13180 [Mesorhizobium sp.]RWK73516.1 MAG: hypothetical protein EOR50_23425 [Mesorhizobium sp.]RWK83735.1 MAG: hypothetical protein EOR51_05890 [Mesorhizobium sp.]RWL06391.1 MAG: hypothetical protein EOR55_10245 [Mesorhizobium sp.]
MAWKREKFTVATDGAGKSVSGLTSSGIGLHLSSDKRDRLRHFRWTVTHLNTGLSLPERQRLVRRDVLGDLVVDQADWAAMADAEGFAGLAL